MAASILITAPLMIALTVTLIVCFAASEREPIGQGVLGMGLRRIALGGLSIVVAAALVAPIAGYEFSSWKLAQGYVPHNRFWYSVVFWALTVFTGYGVVALFLWLVVGLPMLVLLSLLRLRSMIGVLIICIVIISALVGRTWLEPYNLWCETNVGDCVLESLKASAPMTLLAGLGFGLSTRLPMWFSKR